MSQRQELFKARGPWQEGRGAWLRLPCFDGYLWKDTDVAPQSTGLGLFAEGIFLLHLQLHSLESFPVPAPGMIRAKATLQSLLPGTASNGRNWL